MEYDHFHIFTTQLLLWNVGRVEASFIDIRLWCSFLSQDDNKDSDLYYIFFFQDFVFDLMWLKPLCVKLIYRQCFLSIDIDVDKNRQMSFSNFFGGFFVRGNLSNFQFTKDVHQKSLSALHCKGCKPNWVSVKRTGDADHMALT